MGTLSVLISHCCCVLEAVQGSAVIGLFSYWGIQSRTEGCGSKRSDPRIPLPVFHPLFLPSSSSAPIPPPPIYPRVHWKDLWILAGPATGEGPRHHPSQHSSKSVLTKTKWRNLETRPCHERTGLWEHVWENARTQNEAEELQSLEGMPGFSSPAEPGAPKYRMPSQTERSQLRSREREMIQMVRRQKWFRERAAVEDRHRWSAQWLSINY